jgi:hypothetical protein
MGKGIIQYHKNDYIPNQIKVLFIFYLLSLVLFFDIIDPIWSAKIPIQYLQPPIGSRFILGLVTETNLRVLLLIYNTSILVAVLFVRLRVPSFLIMAIASIAINWVNYTSGKIDHQILFWSILPLLFALYIMEYKRKTNYASNSATIILGLFWISSGLAKAYSGYLNFSNYPLRGWLYLYEQDSLLFSIFQNTFSWKLIEISIVLMEILIGFLFILKKDSLAIFLALFLHLNIEFFMGINFIFMIFIYLFIYLTNRLRNEENYPIISTTKFIRFSVLLTLLIFKDFFRELISTVMAWYNGFILVSQFISLPSFIGIIIFFVNYFYIIMVVKPRITKNKDAFLTIKIIVISVIASIQVLFILHKSEPYPLIQGPIFQGNPSFVVKNSLQFYEIVYQKNENSSQISGGLKNLVSDFGENISNEVPPHIRENLIRSIFYCHTNPRYLKPVEKQNVLGCSWHLHRNFSLNKNVQREFLAQISRANNACVFWEYSILNFHFERLVTQKINKVCLTRP